MAAFASIQPQPGAIRMRSVCKSPVILASATHGNGNSIATAMNLASLKATGPSGRWQRGNVAIESIHPPGPSSRPPPPLQQSSFSTLADFIDRHCIIAGNPMRQSARSDPHFKAPDGRQPERTFPTGRNQCVIEYSNR